MVAICCRGKNKSHYPSGRPDPFLKLCIQVRRESLQGLTGWPRNLIVIIDEDLSYIVQDTGILGWSESGPPKWRAAAQPRR
jgi:hypothetical protein